MDVEVAALKTFYKSNRTLMSRLKKTVGKSGDGAETVEDLSATEKWVWEKFSFLKDHIESVEHRNLVSIRGKGRGTPATATATGLATPTATADIIQSDSGAESQSTEAHSRRLSNESADLKRSLMEFMSSKKGGPSTLARHIDESLTQLPGDIKRATVIKLMEVLHEGQRQAEERQIFQQMPIFPQQQQLHSYLPNSTNRQNPPKIMSQSHQLQPSPLQWSTQQMSGQQSISPWGTQDSHFMSSQYPANIPQPPPPKSFTDILDLDTGRTRSSTPPAKKSTLLTPTSSSASSTDTMIDSPNLSDLVRTAMTTAGVNITLPSPVTPQPRPEGDATTMM
jgi:hypothetical protein